MVHIIWIPKKSLVLKCPVPCKAVIDSSQIENAISALRKIGKVPLVCYKSCNVHKTVNEFNDPYHPCNKESTTNVDYQLLMKYSES